MRVLIQRREDAATEATPFGKSAQAADRLFNVRQFTIGSGADQLLQLPGAAVAPAHAVIECRSKGMHIRAIRAAPIFINGKRRRACALKRRDEIRIGDAALTVVGIRAWDVLVLRLSPSEAVPPPDLGSVAPLTLKSAGARKAPYAAILAVATLLLALVVPLWHSLARSPYRGPPAAHVSAPPIASILPGDAVWLPGPLSPSHHPLNGDCKACHRSPFKRVSEGACIDCHRTTEHHVAASQPGHSLFAREACISCHTEHGTPAQLIDRRDASCVNCHGTLRSKVPATALRDVQDFDRSHPEFSKEEISKALTDRSQLKFSHHVHLAARGVEGPGGSRVLGCQDCHQTESSGRYMAPVRMEKHCAACHELRFDEHDPESVVPHGDVRRVTTALQEHFSRMYLSGHESTAEASRRRPGSDAGSISSREQRLALDWTQKESLRAARELLEKRVCVECHTIQKVDGKEPLSQWRVEPVRLSGRWMPKSQFSHVAHRSSPCSACHHQVEGSRVSSDLLMPAIKDCRTCHGGASEQKRAPSDCTTCHDFHLRGKGSYAAGGSQQLVRRVPEEAER